MTMDHYNRQACRNAKQFKDLLSKFVERDMGSVDTVMKDH